MSLSSVKSHANKPPWPHISDLVSQDLSRDEIYNIWCNKMAQTEWEFGTASSSDPDVSPQELWAVYSTFPQLHKVIGDLGRELHSLIGFAPTMSYISTRHGLSDAKLSHINLFALHKYLSSLSLHSRANTIKLIHWWIPTYAMLCRQGRESFPLCPCCQSTIETPEDVISCSNGDAISLCMTHLHTFLSSLVKLSTPIQIIVT